MDLKNDFQSPEKERDIALIPGSIRKGVKMPVVNRLAELKSQVLHLLIGIAG